MVNWMISLQSSVVIHKHYVIDTLGPSEFDHELSIIKQVVAFFLCEPVLTNDSPRQFQYHFIFVRSDGEQLKRITKIIEENGIVPAVDPTEYHIEDINKALNLVATGHPKGKVIIQF
ncbi:hypothetical protein PAECIP111894_03529 [Paenibacillus pseudetheri]|uniref:Zinc-binding dehydrogenase n=1 Tax=Paenibacillus pseudetheri TaxID=2897682 RepID=A0ABM9BFE7_9BACL|nr:hypothetical protein PAECIP111894_03529 [Paenibacillus pseudetheri]